MTVGKAVKSGGKVLTPPINEVVSERQLWEDAGKSVLEQHDQENQKKNPQSTQNCAVSLRL